MALWALIFTGLLLVTPAFAQDASSSSSESLSFSSSGLDLSSSVEPSPPAGRSDADLELAVRAAYTGASDFASANGNYFARDGVLPPLHDAIAAELIRQGYGTIVVPPVATDRLDALKACLGYSGTELRVGTTTYGDGISLVAVTDTRLFAYDYDPHKAAGIVVTKAEGCAAAK